MIAGRPSLRYEIDLAELPGRLHEAYHPLDQDAATAEWIDGAIRQPHGWWRVRAKRLLDHVLSHYDSNGLLDMYDMWLLSSAAWGTFLEGRLGGRLLDVGAGDGRVTAELATHFAETETVETSRQMVKRLRERGFRCHEVDLARRKDVAQGPFDVVSLLNVLDRSLYPRRLLEACVERLGPGGALVLSTPLPLRQHVFVAGEAVDAEERLGDRHASFEAALKALIEDVLEPSGLDVRRFARAPYLSRGDYATALYALDSALIVCEVAPAAE